MGSFVRGDTEVQVAEVAVEVEAVTSAEVLAIKYVTEVN